MEEGRTSAFRQQQPRPRANGFEILRLLGDEEEEEEKEVGTQSVRKGRKWDWNVTGGRCMYLCVYVEAYVITEGVSEHNKISLICYLAKCISIIVTVSASAIRGYATLDIGRVTLNNSVKLKIIALEFM